MRAGGAVRLLVRQARADASTLVTVGMLVLVTALLVGVVPRLLNATADAALRDVLAAAPEPAREITARSTNAKSSRQLEAVDTRLTAGMPAPLREVVGAGGFGATAGRYDTLRPVSREPFRPRPFAWLQLRYQSDLLDGVRWLRGQAPEQAELIRIRGESFPRLEVALAGGVARTLDMRLGDRMLLTPLAGSVTAGDPVVVEVSGVFAPQQRADPSWRFDPVTLTPGNELTPEGDLYAQYASALVSEAQLPLLEDVTTLLDFDWHYPVRTRQVDAANVTGVLAAVEQTTAQGLSLSPGANFVTGVPPVVTTTSGMLDLLNDYLAQAATAYEVSSLVLAGLFVLAVLVLGLATRLSVERRREALALARARGASSAQLIGVAALEAVVVAAPAGAAGYALAVLLVPARPSALSAALLGVLVVGCVGFVSVGFRHAGAAAATGRRTDVVTTRGSRRRAATEAFIVLLGVGGLVLLRRRGVGSAADGADPFLATVPVLLVLGAGVLALRAYPWILRPVVRLVGDRPGAVGFVALARAARAPFTSTLPLAVLLLGLGFSVFASAVETTVSRGQEASAWATVGADYRLQSFAFFDGQLRRVAAIEGVSGTAAAYAPEESELAPDSDEQPPIRFIAVDTATYVRLVADAPAGLVPQEQLGVLTTSSADSTGALPALVSPGVAAVAGDRSVTVDAGFGVGINDIRVRAVAKRFPTDGGGDFVVVDLVALQAANETPVRPNELFVRAPASADAAITRTVDDFAQDVIVSDRADVLADTAGNPLVAGTVAAFRLGTSAAAGYCFLAALLALVLGTAARARLLSALRTLGIERRQALALVAVELAPMVAVVVLTGLAVGVTLPYLLLPAVNLSPFTGGGGPPPPRVDILVAGGLAVGLVAVVAAAAVVTTVVERRRRLGEAARIGAAT